MSIMIPSVPRRCDARSLEDQMFEALERMEPDDGEYYVVHSLSVNKITAGGNLHEGESDFVVFHPKKGILVLEAKATYAEYRGGEWYYAGGFKMHSGGPFEQAKRGMHAIEDYMTDHGLENIQNKCKFLFAVWFPMVTASYIAEMNLPMEAAPELILTNEALMDPKSAIDRLFSYKGRGKEKVNLTEEETRRILDEVLCPHFEIVPSAVFHTELQKVVYHRLLKEQANVLNFLEDQKVAVICGAAGTGKTLVAVEKAKQEARKNNEVLFLCFNRRLKDFLAESYSEPQITYATLAGLACKLCHTGTADLSLLKERLQKMKETNTFPFKHVIVDEGQDFGRYIEASDEENESEDSSEDREQDSRDQLDVLSLLRDNIVDNKEDGSFYVFYDRLQMIQAHELPAFMDDADCRLTLYRNCRNTANIAKTSLAPVTERLPKMLSTIAGIPSRLHFCPAEEYVKKAVDRIIEDLITGEEPIENIVILTCRTTEKSAMAPFIKNEIYTWQKGKKKLIFTTCRKFKGLEADAIILTDITKEILLDDGTNGIQRFYVGASRARLRLELVAQLSQEDCAEALLSLFHRKIRAGQKADQILASEFHAKFKDAAKYSGDVPGSNPA